MRRCVTNEKGIFLPVMLLFLQIMMLFTFWALQSELLNAKTIRLTWQKEQFDNDLAQIVKVIEDQTSNCVVPATPTETIQNAPLSWWKTETCAGNFRTIEYYYVVEALGTDSCAHIVNTQDVADYYRISVFAVDNQNDFKALIQSSLVKPGKEQDRCVSHAHDVQSGQQSWQRLEQLTSNHT